MPNHKHKHNNRITFQEAVRNFGFLMGSILYWDQENVGSQTPEALIKNYRRDIKLEWSREYEAQLVNELNIILENCSR